MFEMIQRIIETVGLVTLVGLAYHAGIMHNRVTKLEQFVNDVTRQFTVIDKKLDRVVNMLFAHVDSDKKIVVQRETRDRYDEMDKD